MRSLTRKPTRGSRPRAAGKDSERGFTLIETAIALIIMMVAGLAVSSLFIYAINYNSGSYSRTLAIAVAQQRMENLRKGAFSEVVSSTEADVTSGNNHFSVDTAVTGTGLKNITVTVTPLGGSSEWMRRPVVIISQRANTGTGTYY